MLFRAVACGHEYAVSADTVTEALEKLKADPKVSAMLKDEEEEGCEADVMISERLLETSPGVFSLVDR